MALSKRMATGHAEALRQLRLLGPALRDEATALQRQIAELQVLLRQTTGEVDRVTPQSNLANQRLRDMEAHLDSYSRADIKTLYTTAQEGQMRVFMMQLQQEQIQSKLRVMSTSHEAMSRIVALADQVEADADDDIQEEEDETAAVSSQELLSRVIEAQEDERRRLSRQMHDGPAQALANLVLRAEICERLIVSDQEAARKDLADMKKLVVNSLQDARHFIFDLRPMILDDLGLAPTLRRYCEILGETATTPIVLSVSGQERRLGANVEIAIFRVIQEAVRNALKHSEANVVQLALEMEPHAVKVTIRDNGRGCDPEAAKTGARRGQHVGLARMEELARSVNGSLGFESKPGHGCQVTMSVYVT